MSSLAHPHTSGHDSVARSAKTGAREEYGVTFLASMQTALLLQEWRKTTGSGQMKGGKETGSKRRPVRPGASMCTAMALATTRRSEVCRPETYASCRCDARWMLREGDAQNTLHHTHIHIIRSVDVFRLALPSTTAALQVARICAPRQGPHAASVFSRRPQCVGAVSVSGHTYCQ